MKHGGWLVFLAFVLAGGFFLILWLVNRGKRTKQEKGQEPPRKTPSRMSESQKLETLELLHDLYELYQRTK